MTVRIERVGPEAADAVHTVVQAAFAARAPLDPPADALQETVEDVRTALEHGGGLLASLDARPVGAMVLDPEGDTLWLRRVSVLPAAQEHGIGGLLIAEAFWAGTDFAEIAVLARAELPGTVRLWQHEGFTETARHAPYVELRRPGTAAYDVVDAEEMRALGERLGAQLRAGDLLVLTGELGAGKTTFTQGLAAGLEVRGAVTSPTFVIARVHPSLVEGPDLVHVDAYRLDGALELDDLDLDTSLNDAVTVVEWGAGIAEDLAESRLEVRIVRATGMGTDDLDPRRVLVAPVGPRWASRLHAGTA